MLGSRIILASLVFGLARASALPEPRPSPIEERQIVASPRPRTVLQNCNSATNRACWMQPPLAPFDVSSDAETTWPATGAEVFYDLHITKKTLSPDGKPKEMLVINNQYPGPVIQAQWGDRMTLTVYNDMTDNGTSMHWHGLIQANTTTMDGVNGITECPIPPGSSRRYSFIATQHGTTWYHSHYSGQYGDGIVGTIIINGPATQNYEEELGTLPVTDWYVRNVYQLGIASEVGAPPPGDSALINGTMKVGSAGSYSRTKLSPGKKHRLRLINTSVDNMFQVSLDGHDFEVIAADFVPIKPFNTTWLFLGIGQRYDVIITANQAPTSYWFRAQIPSPFCGSNPLSTAGGIKSIFTYSNSSPANSTADPVSQPKTAFPTVCGDPSANLVPKLTKPVPANQFVFHNTNGETTLTLALTTRPSNNQPGTVNSWRINGSELDVEWSHPTVKYIFENRVDLLAATPGATIGKNVILLGEENKFHFFAIQNTGGIPHPIHLHGHDFYVLGQFGTQFTESMVGQLNFANPMRRDVAMLPGGGSLIMAFESNNPGAWLMHCHIAWHVAQGLGLQFVEQQSKISRQALQVVNDECQVWDTWYNSTIFKKFDSGL